ncbi:MAG: c-type cytochrome [Bacteroidales bacterium]|nr:c-type cytochrome [Bacteroidales bacterium]
MLRFGWLVVSLIALTPDVGRGQSVRRADLKPGLVLTITEPNQSPLSRLEPAVALTLAPGESPHPKLTAGESFTWKGYINILLPGKYRFDADLAGQLTVSVDGKPVFSASSPAEAIGSAQRVRGVEVELLPGIQPFVATLTRVGQPLRVDLIWSGPGFTAEPIPYFFFGHLPSQRPQNFAAAVAQEHGRFLFEEHGCIHCHRPTQPTAMMRTLVERTGPDLTEIGRRAYPGWLDAWLADPRKLRPNSVMPKLFADTPAGQAERYAVTAYLASLGGPVPEPKPVDGNQYRKSIGNGSKLFITAGCAACHGDKLTGPPTQFVNEDLDADEKPVFTPEDQFYSLGTAGPTGYYRLGHVGSKFTAEGLARFLLNPHATNPHGRMPNMTLSGSEATDIARFLARQQDDTLTKAMPREPKQKPAEGWIAFGQKLVIAKGCINCHTIAPGGKKLTATLSVPLPKPQAQPQTDAATSCLAEKPNVTQVPVFALNVNQKAALTAFLQTGFHGTGSESPVYQTRHAIKRFFCLNCHNRDGEGGIDPALSDMMKKLENAQNADDVQPPRLTGAGRKLRTPWLHQVLTQAGRARPWMTLRMPQYGPQNVGFLTHGLPKLEGDVTDETIGKVADTPATIAAGRELAGKTGFGCVACHDISGVPGGGTRGPDLATINQRVRHEWYVRWMHQPQRLVPGTKMPQNFINGRSQIDRFFQGEADPQIEALWAYLALGPGLPLPPGMEPPKGVVVAVKDRPELLRTFMPDNAGTKAIAVGYPGGVNLVFDAAQARIGYGWTGSFLNMTPVWTNRGGQPAILLGPKFWTAPAGHPWAVTASRTPPDFTKRAENPAYGRQLPQDALYNGPRLVHFEGYGLDTKGQPTFRYSLDDAETGKKALTVAEKPTPLPVSVAAGLLRTFAVQAPAGQTVWFLGGESSGAPRVYGPSGAPLPLDLKAAEVETPAVGSRVVLPRRERGAAVLELASGPPGTHWRFVPKEGGWWAVLRLPETAQPAVAEFSLAIWGLNRDDANLLKGLKAR